MDVEATTPAGLPIVSREKVCRLNSIPPLLDVYFIPTRQRLSSSALLSRLVVFTTLTSLKTAHFRQRMNTKFIHGSYHRFLFPKPFHIFSFRKDATLREVLTALRNAAPHVSEFRHPLARFAFRTVYADSGNKGRFYQKDLSGMIYSRDILGEPGTLNTTAPRLMEDHDGEVREPTEREKEERTLDELRFVPGDYLLINLTLPKNVTTEIGIKGAAAAAAGPTTSNGWKTAGRGDGGWSGSLATSAPVPAGQGRGNGHWRGDSNAPSAGGRGRGGGRGDFVGGRGGGDFGRVRDSDRRVPPPRRGDSPPARGRGGWGDRGGRGERAGGRRSRSRSPSRSRSRSRSRTPPRRRRFD